MKVGDYVRLDRCQGINRIDAIDEIGTFYLEDIIGDEWGDETFRLDTNDVINSSPNIIDLIEEDDLIRIEYEISTGETQKEVLQVIKNNAGKLFVNTWKGKRFLEDFKNYDIGIISILTREQFNMMRFQLC